MLRLKAERRSLAKVSGASAPQSRGIQTRGVADSTIKTPARPAPASRRRAKPIRTTLVCTLGLALVAAGILGAGWLADHLPNLILGLCVVLLGVLVGAMLAAES